MMQIKKQINIDSEDRPKKIFSKNALFNFKKINQLFLILIIILGVYYIYGANSILAKGFELKRLRDYENQLIIETQNFELNIMSLSSYNNISQRIKNIKMVMAGEVDYITSSLEMVAKK